MCLKWESFSGQLASTFQDFETDAHFTDVTLVSDDQIQMKAHRASSEVLKNLVIKHPHSLVFLEARVGIYTTAFFYFRKTTIHKDRANEFQLVLLELEVKEIFKEDDTIFWFGNF